MIYLSQLARATPAKIRRNSLKVRITHVKAFFGDDEHGEHKYVTCKARTRGKSTGPYIIAVRLYPNKSKKVPKSGKMKPNNRSWVHCSCPYFRYHCEVADAARGSSNVITSTGAYPKIRNPKMKPILCKHLMAAIKVVTDAKPKRRRITQIDDVELDHLVKLLDPFIPKK